MISDAGRHPIEDDQQAIEDAIYLLTLAAELVKKHADIRGGNTGLQPGETPLASLIRNPVNITCLAAVDILARRLKEIVSDEMQAEHVFGRIAERVEFATGEAPEPIRWQ